MKMGWNNELGWEGEAVTCVAVFHQGSKEKLTEFLPGKGWGKMDHCDKLMEILQKQKWQFRYVGQLHPVSELLQYQESLVVL